MNLLIIQARMGSTRLPGKVLMKINEKSILEHLVSRITPSQSIDQIVIATTTNTEDDALAQFCLAKGWAYTRGSDWDVLDRFYQTAKQYPQVKNIVRITADCPLHHHSVIDFVVKEYENSAKDYFSNSNHEPDFLEDGFDVEVFSFKALESAWKEAKLLSEREHVTPYIKNSGQFTCEWKKYQVNYCYKLSVDTLDDFRAVQEIFQQFNKNLDFGMNEVISLLKEHPEILKLNQHSSINSGYKKSLAEDKTIK